MRMRSGWLACVILTSCSQLVGLADFGSKANGGDGDASAPAADPAPSGGPVPNVPAGEPGVIEAAASEAAAGASAEAGRADDGPTGADATLETGADAGAGAPTDGAPDAGGDTQADSTDDGPPDAAADGAPDAEPAVTFTPADASLSILAFDAGICSLNGGQSATLHVVNARDAGATLEWVGTAPSCSETSYGNFAPGGTVGVSTYVTHVWRVRNQADGRFLVEFRLDSPASYTVTVH